MTKIAYILSQFPQTYETFILREIRALKERGVDIQILSLKPCRDKVVHPEAKELVGKTVYPKVYNVYQFTVYSLLHPIRTFKTLSYVIKSYIYNPKELFKALYVWLECFYFLKVIRQEKISHIHSHWATMPTTAAMVLNRLTGTPFSFTAHAWDIFVSANGLSEKIKRARFAVTCTDYNRRYLSRFCRDGEAEKIYLNYHGIDLEGTSLAMTESEKLKILSIGRLVETKGFAYLIAACRKLRDRKIDFECQIVGEGAFKNSLQSIVHSQQLENYVKFVGVKTQKEIKELYHRASLLVQPSVIAKDGDRDGIPNVILEAMAVGVPVISTNISGMPEVVINGKTGILVSPKDSPALACAIENLWRNPLLRKELATNARKLIEDKFVSAKNAEELMRIFHTNSVLHSTVRPLNVLHIIWSLEVGGAERALIYLAKGADRKKINPIVCCLNHKGILAEELEREGIKVIALNKKRKTEIAVIKKLIAVIRENDIQIVHTHMWGANFWGRIAARLAKVPVIIATEQNVDFWKNGLYLWLDKILSYNTDKIVAVSGKVKEFYVQQAGISPQKIEVIFNPVDLNQYKFSPSDINGDKITLGVIGRLEPQKGHRYFLLAFKELLKQYKVKGLIIGAGPLKEKLQQFCQNLGLDGTVTFTGLRQDVPQLLRDISILVLPSLREGLPLVALEAMASGVLVVATKVGGTPEAVIDGKTGLLVEPRSHIAIKEAVSRLIEDRGLARQLVRTSREEVEDKFSAARIVQTTQRLYEQLYQK